MVNTHMETISFKKKTTTPQLFKGCDPEKYDWSRIPSGVGVNVKPSET